jgi:glutathione S-transferase
MLILHHLVTSRSSRIIWLLEALGIEYEMVTHQRGPNLRALPDLSEVHPLGKAPTIVDGDLTLVESATILRYIAERYGNSQFMPPAGTAARAKHDQWLDYAESSLMSPLMIKLMGLMGGGLPPALDDFVSKELNKALSYINDGVSKGPFLMGDELTLADLQLSYCLAMAEIGGMLQDRPAIQAYWKRLQQEPGYQRTIEIGGPLMPSLSKT